MANEEQATTFHTSPFDAIRRVDEMENEYWSARELAKLLGYAKWDKFKIALERAQKACRNSNQAASDHFLQSGKLISAGKGAQRTIEDYHLSRYACYLIVENADSSKPIVALGQTYFAVQTRRQELADNIFRAAQTDAKLRRDQIQGKYEANQTHFEVGCKVRQTIEDLGGTMPEDLPTPEKSIQQIQREEHKRLQQGPQLSLFEAEDQ